MTNEARQSAGGPAISAADDVVQLCTELLQIDTTNTGDDRTTVGRAGGRGVRRRQARRGRSRDARCIESEPGRASVVARIEGADRAARRC